MKENESIRAEEESSRQARPATRQADPGRIKENQTHHYSESGDKTSNQ